LVQETGVPGGNHRPAANNWQTFMLCELRISSCLWRLFICTILLNQGSGGSNARTTNVMSSNPDQDEMYSINMTSLYLCMWALFVCSKQKIFAIPAPVVYCLACWPRVYRSWLRALDCCITPTQQFFSDIMEISCIFIVLVHWNNTLRIRMSPHSDTLSWLRANQPFLFLQNLHDRTKNEWPFNTGVRLKEA
jgi:hypothetical protein